MKKKKKKRLRGRSDRERQKSKWRNETYTLGHRCIICQRMRVAGKGANYTNLRCLTFTTARIAQCSVKLSGTYRTGAVTMPKCASSSRLCNTFFAFHPLFSAKPVSLTNYSWNELFSEQRYPASSLGFLFYGATALLKCLWRLNYETDSSAYYVLGLRLSALSLY